MPFIRVVGREHFASRLALLVAALTVLAACTTEAPLRKDPHAAKPHPLKGKLYRVGEAQPTPFFTLLERMKSSDVIYLGETHDNRAHHHIEQQVIAQLIGQGLRPALGFEFFSREQTSHLLRYRNAGKKKKDGKSAHGGEAASAQLLRAQLGWQSNRDTDWDRFRPILQQARELQLPLFGADLPVALRRNLSFNGYDGLNPVEQLGTTRSGFEDAVYRGWMLEELRKAHCGWGNADYHGRLYQTWVARNEAMAEAIVAMARANPGQPVVVILGGAHTGYNMGVYERVANLMPDARQMNIRMLQADPERAAAAEYFKPLVRGERDFGPPYEYIWFTSGPPRSDKQCEEFHHAKKHTAKAGGS